MIQKYQILKRKLLIIIITKTDFDTELQKISDRVISNKTKHFLVENELKN